MSVDTYLDIQKLQKMNVAQLKVKYLEVFGEQARSGHKNFLRKKIAWRIQALAEGGLSDRARRIALEIANDADLRMRAPKMTRTGGNGQPGPTVIAKANDTCQHHVPLPGTYLVRDFRGKTHTVSYRLKAGRRSGKRAAVTGPVVDDEAGEPGEEEKTGED